MGFVQCSANQHGGASFYPTGVRVTYKVYGSVMSGWDEMGWDDGMVKCISFHMRITPAYSRLRTIKRGSGGGGGTTVPYRIVPYSIPL